ncbi:leucine-rich repeat-containing G-protein coupled receptor 4-like [Bradysia coprophila]|uniref:leucine-rich repeat-containing G-protein coupled receptor 4-like n=1 Tax=Bradysia coprophila TaxID=38358 RepID=UPI00187DD0A9|nr:leucine-rich repeat-containing G-protein coupled receptor 4-like [Bradysia coprophila]
MKMETFSVLLVLAAYTMVTSSISVACVNKGWYYDIPEEDVCIIKDVQLPTAAGDHLQFDYGNGSADTMAALHISLKSNDSSNVTIPTEVFEILPKLQIFSIEYVNAILPSTFRNASNLKILILALSRFSEINEHTFDGLDKLESLNLQWDKNVTRTISGKDFSIPSLQSLRLRRSQLLSIGDDPFDLPKLIDFDLSDNNLTSLSDLVFSKLPNLQELMLNNNKLVHIGDSLRNLPNIKTIGLHFNSITDIDLHKFAELPHLETLNLWSSGFSFPLSEKPTILRNRSLKTLNLSSNNLKYACDLGQLRIFEGITTLDLSSNQYENFVYGISHLKTILPNLRMLRLSNNKIDCTNCDEVEKQFKKQNVTRYS